LSPLVDSWNRFWFSPADPRDLALGRIVFCVGVLMLFGNQPWPLWAQVGEAFRQPIKVLGLASFEPLARPWLDIAWGLWRLSLLTAALGFLTRVSLGVAFVLGFYLLALPHHFGRLEHTDGVVVILLGVLAASRCGDAWSLDAWRARRRDRAVERPPHGAYRWPVRAAQLVLCTIFFSAGIAKLRHGGLEWITSDTLSITLLRAQLQPEGVGPVVDWGRWLAGQRATMILAAAGTIAIELGYPLALLHRRSRWVLLPAMVGLLVGFRVLMGPWFGTFILAHVFWVPWSRWLRLGSPPADPRGPSAAATTASQPLAGAAP
jgi:hypothetical protein